jgi:RNA polymerase sigma factor (sigma-70 family)
MSRARSSDMLRQVRTLFGVGVVAGLSDAELLERFALQKASAEDARLAAEAAFAVLVARHGPMVLGVCRRALADPGDVEDAFQATFLVLVRRARSVRAGDSLGRWLYGVARRVAAKARARSDRARGRSAPLEVEPAAPEVAGDRVELLAALDEEVSRLPERYRAPVVLCHLEGLSHAEAADRLRWPVGTVSGRLSRARDLLRDRLARRGLAPTAGSMVALLAAEGARAAVPDPLAAATVRAASRLAMGGGAQAGAVSASALSLMKAVLRAAVAVKLKVAAAVLLAIAVAGAAVGAGIGVGGGARGPASDRGVGRAPAVAADVDAHPSAGHRPADEIVEEIEAMLKAAADLSHGNFGELRLMPAVKDVGGIPTEGKNLVIVADVDHVLHFRIFDRAGKMVVDTDEKKPTAQRMWIEFLRQQVAKWWPPHELTRSEKSQIITAVKSIDGHPPIDELRRAHGRIAELVGELRAVYPDDPRVAHYLPVRWESLGYFAGKRDMIRAEIREVLETTRDPALRKDTLFLEVCYRFVEPIDGLAAVSLAESFARQVPGDKRVGNLFYNAATRLDSGWYAELGLAVIFALAAGMIAATIGMSRWLKYAVRLGEGLLGLSVFMLGGFFLLANDILIASIQLAYEKVCDGSAIVAVLAWAFTMLGYLPETLDEPYKQQRILSIACDLWTGAHQQVRVISGTIRAAFSVSLAALAAAILVVARRRLAGTPMRWLSAVRLAIMGFLAVLAVACVVDACRIAYERNAIRDLIVREYPDSFQGRLIQGERRQRDRIGEPFELEFNDAITGRHVSMKDLRGKVVVVEFSATWCGPCVEEVPEMQRLYAEYHDKGVEFIGVSHDDPEAEGGLEALRAFVAEWKIPWPQYYQGMDSRRALTGEPTGDFSESWGVSSIPTVFLIDAEGNLYSTEARGKLDTLIPRLLRESSSGRATSR